MPAPPRVANAGDSGQKDKVLVGVDFGTTFSGISFTCPPLEHSFPPRIHTINGHRKIPTRLCYCITEKFHKVPEDDSDTGSSTSGEQEEKIIPVKSVKCRTLTDDGYSTELRQMDDERQYRESSYSIQGADTKLRYIWGDIKDCNNLITAFKLTFENQAEGTSTHSKLVPLENLVIDYLQALRMRFEVELGQTYPKIKTHFDKYERDWTFTVPAFFSPEMVGKFKAILARAGFNEPINIVSEPAAGLLYAIWSNAMAVNRSDSGSTYLQWEHPEQLQPGSRIIVCDAGGGTTDLEAVEILSIDLHETGMPHAKLRPLQWTDGDKVGSINIEQDFSADVISRLRNIKLWDDRGQNPSILPSSIIDMDKFIEIKESFDYDSFVPRFLQLYPDPSTGGWREDHPAVGIHDGFIRLDSATMERYFARTVGQLKQLVEKYLRSIEERKEDIQGILFIGGLTASPYTRKEMKIWAERRGVRPIFAPPGRPEDALLAVMRGAVLTRFQLLSDEGMPPTTSFLARSSFGIVLDMPFEPHKHDRSDYRHSVTHKEMVKNEVVWLVKKGDEVHFDKKIKIYIRQEYFVKSGPRVWTYKLVRCDETDHGKIPTSADSPEVIGVCEETLDLSQESSKNKKYFVQHKIHGKLFQVSVKYFEVELHIRLEFVSATELKYDIKPVIHNGSVVPGKERPLKRKFQWFWGRSYKQV